MQNNSITLLSVIRAIKENGNTYRSSGNYFIVKDDMTYVKINGSMYEATGEVHTHPYMTDDMYNPLMVSSEYISMANNYFEGIVNILVTSTYKLYNVSVNGNGLMFPKEIKWR